MTTKRVGAWAVLGGSLISLSSVLPACGSSDDAAPAAGAGGTAGNAGSAGTGGTAGDTDGGSGTGGTDGGTLCGNRQIDGTEECDDGNTTDGDGCDSCFFSCTAANAIRKCDDKNACTGVETCDETTHTCKAGTPLDDGDSCGSNGEICKSGNCILASCGDGQTSAGEECDDGNVTPGDGCENDCKFSCVSTDTARNCSQTATDCVNGGTCDDATHRCTPGGNKPDNTTPCNNGAGFCKGGVCTTATCGNGTTEPGEECDDANANDADGCKQDCKFTCKAAADCSDSNSCTNDVCNTTTHVCSNPANAGQNGQSCTVGGVTGLCSNGTCAPASCGNGTREGTEQCDRGAQNGQAGSGCTTGCAFSCNTNADCTDNNACTGNETCDNVAGGAGKTCSNPADLATGAVCNQSPRSLCNASKACVASTCGDGTVDNANGGTEQCEPPNTATCSATCQTIQQAACGNNVLEAGEQCDDGNTARLDGCDNACKYEAVYRLTDIDILKARRPSFCTSPGNALGGAIDDAAIGQINTPLQDGITDGTTNVLIQALGLDDLTGVSDSALELGIMTGSLDPAKGTWTPPASPAQSPIDWWFLVDPNTVDANGRPTGLLGNGSVAARTLNAGPGTVTLALLLSGSPAQLQMRNAKVRANIDGSPAPNRPAPPPSNLATGLTVAQTITATTATSQGLCGDITVESLSRIPVPETLTTGTFACNGSSVNGSPTGRYTYCGAGNPVGPNCNSLLDVFVNGCRVTVAIFTINAVRKTQPDIAAGPPPATPVALTADPTTFKVPDRLTTGNNDAYSAFLSFRGNRAHITGRQ